MSRIRANNIVNGAGTGAPTFPNGAIINGITTITADVATTGNNLTIGTGTTISNPSDNEFRILTNGGERVRVDSSGNVGIGTEEPTKALHISQNSDVAIRLQARNANVDNTSWEIVVGGNASNDAEMVFRTRNDAGTGGSEIARFTTGGDLKFPSGGGIDFSATADGSGTVTSEIFDDYEEGTWTPTYEPQTNSFTSITYDPVVYGYYQKVGEVVHITGFIRTDALTIGTASGNLYLGGLPYSPHVGPGENQSIYVSNSAAWAGDHPTFGLNSGSGDRFALYYKTAINADTSVINVSDMATGVDDNQIYFTGWFRAT